jgi:tRNA-specific 2-thiouridylase
VDASKDQSYFLHRLTQAQLSHTLFPLGELHKSKIRSIADELQLPNAKKKDSTGICFIGERPFRAFLNRYLSFKPGPMKTPDGDVVGEHVGLSFYTLGQRKGIGLGGQRAHRDDDGNHAPWYVARKDVESNTLYVVQGHDHPWLLSDALVAGQMSWVAGTPPADGPLLAKTRYRQSDVACALLGAGGTEAKLQFQQAQWAVTPGQSAVLYDGDICLGGGIIERAEAA